MTVASHSESALALITRTWRQAPDRVAVMNDGESVTYDELRARVERVTAGLRVDGVGAGDRVGVALGPTTEAIVAMLAVWATGASYVPMDLSHPPERLGALLTVTGAKIIIASLPGPPPTGSTVSVTTVDELARTAAPTDPEQEWGGGTEAYVITTSGSTGPPKAIAIHQANLAWFLTRFAERIGIGAHDRLVARTGLTFDPHTVELFLPLTVGATIITTDDNSRRDPEALASVIARFHATVVQGTPSFWSLLTNSGWSPQHAITALCGGEALTSRLHSALTSLHNLRLWNVYGPTETTVWAGALEMSAVDPIRIGGPLSGATWAVLDADEEPVSDGVIGELWITGPGVGAGYLAKATLTERTFRHRTDGSSGVWYRTGDLVRRHADATFDYVGRIDRQIKFLGQRVDLGDIEAAVRTCPMVAQVVVFVTSTGRLRAAVVPATTHRTFADRELVNTGVMAACERALPAPIRPSEFVYVDALPVTDNEKVDLAALGEQAAYVLTKGALLDMTDYTVVRVAHVVGDVLRVPAPTRDASFFELGGDSLSIARLRLRLREEFGFAPSIAALHEAPTVTGIRAALTSRGDSSAAPEAGIAALTAGQRRILSDPLRGPTNLIELLVITAEAPDRVHSALQRLIEAHDVFHVSRVTGTDQWFAAGAVVTVEEWSSSTLTLEGLLDTLALVRESIDATTGTLSRVGFACIDQRTYVYVALHHVLADDFSIEVLKHVLDSLLAGESVEAQTTSITFHQWAELISAAFPTSTSRRQRLGNGRDPLPRRSGHDGFQVIEVARTIPLTKWPLHVAPARVAHEVLLAAHAHVLGERFGIQSVGCRVAESGRGLRSGCDDSLTLGMLSHHHLVSATIGAKPADTLRSMRAELNRDPSRGQGHEWANVSTAGPGSVAVDGGASLYLNYLPVTRSLRRLTDETRLLRPGRVLPQRIDGLGVVIRRDEDEVRIRVVFNASVCTPTEIEEYLDQVGAALAELAAEAFGAA